MGGKIESGKLGLRGEEMRAFIRQEKPFYKEGKLEELEGIAALPTAGSRKLGRIEKWETVAPGFEVHSSATIDIERTERDYEG